MGYHFISVEDVISDEDFLAWYGKTDPDKSSKWEHWLEANPDNKPIVQDAIAYLNDIYVKEQPLSNQQIQNAFLRLLQTIDASTVVEMKPSRKRWWIPAAAVLLLVAGIAFWKSGPAKTTYESAFGKITEYKLPDGSRVTLNAHSELSLSKQWEGGKDREVWLKGEAFFKVQKTPQHNRFVVHTDAMDIVVTGTQFNVVTRDDESSVYLTEGSVTVISKDGKEIHMQPGDFVRLENNLPQKKAASEEKVLAWKQSKLVFDNTSLKDVAAIVTRYYGVTIHFDDSSIAGKRIGGVMPNDNLDVLIASLEATNEFRITKSGNELIISNP